MPIRPENRALYPADWQAISARIRLRDGFRCKFCGVRDRALGGRDPCGNFMHAMPKGDDGLRLVWPRRGEHWWCHDASRKSVLRIISIVLTVAHLDHDPTNCADDNLAALCQRCHLRHDAKHHAETAYATRMAARRTPDLFEVAPQ